MPFGRERQNEGEIHAFLQYGVSVRDLRYDFSPVERQTNRLANSYVADERASDVEVQMGYSRSRGRTSVRTPRNRLGLHDVRWRHFRPEVHIAGLQQGHAAYRAMG